jgi:hypothetical protein
MLKTNLTRLLSELDLSIVDHCLTLQILRWDSGIESSPISPWNTFVPEHGMIAYVTENDSYYMFTGNEWEILTEDLLLEFVENTQEEEK